MSRKRILVVSCIFVFPLDSGAARDIYSRLKALYEAGYEIDLIATVRNSPSELDMETVRPLVKSITFVHRSRKLLDLIRLDPYLSTSRRNLEAIVLEHDYVAVILESERVGKILDNPTLRTNHRILRIHNDESYYHRCLAERASTLRQKLFFALESLKLKLYSPKVIRRCDVLWYISLAEMNKFKNDRGLTGHSRSFLVRNVIDPGALRQQPLSGRRVFYVGALFIGTNRDGLLWYLRDVHPRMLSIPGYEFVLAGRTGDADLTSLMKTIESAEQVSFRPDAPELGEYFASSAAFVNPILAGAGVKIKIYDATTEGLPVITTSVGAEGTGFENGIHAVIEDSAELFASGLSRVLLDKEYAHQLVRNAQAQLAFVNRPEEMLKSLSSLD